MMRGVLDRFESSTAVILLEEDNKEITLPTEVLPEGSFEGIWFHLSEHNGNYKVNSIDVAKTESKTSANALLLEQMKKKSKGSKFKK